jgi:Mrp family chromosome partitioning ATPase
MYDLIIVDMPAMLDHADVTVAAKLFDAILLVTRHGITRVGDVTRALDQSTRIQALTFGAVLNRYKA